MNDIFEKNVAVNGSVVNEGERSSSTFSPGQVERRIQDYVRHGKTSLCAALNVATGGVIGKCCKRHRAIEFKRFLWRDRTPCSRTT